MIQCIAAVPPINKNYKQSKQRYLDAYSPFENKFWNK